MDNSDIPVEQSGVTVMPGISSLDCLDTVFSFLSAKDVARAMCVQKQWHQAGCSEHLWKGLLEADWGILAPVTIHSATLNSHREAYRHWEQELGRYNGPDQMPKRAAALWRKLETWFRANIPSIADSLLPGLTEEQLDASESLLGNYIRLPPALRLLYRFKNGQRITGRSIQGLFGGYSFYGESVNTVLLELPVTPADTRVTGKSGAHPQFPHMLLIAASVAGSPKVIGLNVNTGEIVPCNALFIDPHRQSSWSPRLCPPGKTALDWLEEFANRLESSMYRATRNTHRGDCREGGPALSLFPESQAGGMVEQTTGGVRIRASALYCPERSVDGRHFFAYSVRYYLLPVEEQQGRWSMQEGPFRPKLSVQLQTRKWYIRDGDGIVYDIVEGPGVVGNFPILTSGGEEYAYQSCNHSVMPSGSMDGYFAFVEGTVARPAGPSFNAVCPRFQLVVPDYSY